jgi:hypothetical protein
MDPFFPPPDLGSACLSAFVWLSDHILLPSPHSVTKKNKALIKDTRTYLDKDSKRYRVRKTTWMDTIPEENGILRHGSGLSNGWKDIWDVTVIGVLNRLHPPPGFLGLTWRITCCTTDAWVWWGVRV